MKQPRSKPRARVSAPSSSARRAGIEPLRRICLALPEVAEVEAWGDPTFRVKNKIFAMHKIGDGRSSVWCKALPAAQAVLVSSAPERFFVPPYVGHRGWVGIRLDRAVDWSEVERLMRTSYRLIAPRKLASSLDEPNPEVVLPRPARTRARRAKRA